MFSPKITFLISDNVEEPASESKTEPGSEVAAPAQQPQQPSQQQPAPPAPIGESRQDDRRVPQQNQQQQQVQPQILPKGGKLEMLLLSSRKFYSLIRHY